MIDPYSIDVNEKENLYFDVGPTIFGNSLEKKNKLPDDSKEVDIEVSRE